MVTQSALHSDKRHSSPLEDGDLDSIPILTSFADGSELQWGVALTHAPPGWPEDRVVLVQGIDWMAEFVPPGKQDLPLVIKDGKNSRLEAQTINEYFVLVRVATHRTTLSDARDYGRTAVRAALAILQRFFPALTAQTILWEGAIRLMANQKSMFMAAGLGMSVSGVTAENIPREGLELAGIKIENLPEHLKLSLNWYNRAWMADSRIDRFVHFWLAAVVIIDHGYSRNQLKKVVQDKRIEEYVGKMLLSNKRADDLITELQTAYDVRNELQHEGQMANVTADSVERLQKAIDELIWFEVSQTKLRN